MPSPTTPPNFSEYMAALGRRGGKKSTAKQLAAKRKNIKKAHKTIQKLFPKDR